MENRFFTLLWRFNAVVISLLGILGIIFGLYVGYMILTDSKRDTYVENLSSAPGKESAKEHLIFDEMKTVPGNDLVLIPLESYRYYARGYRSSYSGKNASAVRNYLFLNPLTSEQSWLYPHHDFIITEVSVLPKSRCRDEQKRASAILYYGVKKDTNGDGMLSVSDHKYIAVSDSEGKQYRDLVEGVDTILGHKQVNETAIVISFVKDAVTQALTVDINTLSLINSAVLSSKLPSDL